ncbi:MAG: alanine racemase [Bacteroidota bacterium]
MDKNRRDAYFEQLTTTLKNYQRAIPCLLIDLDIIDENLTVLTSELKTGVDFRIVVKSLPSLSLINYIREKMNTDKLMVFHQPFLSDLSSTLDQRADVLLGKPMPIRTAQYYYKTLPKLKNDFDPYRQVQWLVDTEARIFQYISLAQKLGKRLRLNLELDVGLHRGGFKNLGELRKGLKLMHTHIEAVAFSGFVGYEPHIVKIPKFIRRHEKSLKMSNSFYASCQQIVQKEFPELWSNTLTFNGAGSPTLNLHQTEASPLNDISAGSCLVKPTTFDIPSLNKFKPACFIATPVLKKFQGTTLPGLERMKPLLNRVNPRYSQSFFIYGGYWKADYHYPKGTKQNSVFGASTNQTMVNTPASAKLGVDDFVFLRPHQSEFVFLQFGELLVVKGKQIVDKWGLLSNR